MNPIAEFCEATRSRGLMLAESDVIADGALHRCDVEAKGTSGRGDGAYILHMDGNPAGGFENHRDGLGWENWCAKRSTPPTAAERMALRVKIEEQRKIREAEEAQRRAEMRERVQAILEKSEPATTHEYAERKGVKIEGRRLKVYRGSLELAGMRCDGALVMPLYFLPALDAKPELAALQFIAPNGDKRFMGPTGGCFFSIGGKVQPGKPLLICEGLATGLSLHEATGYPVVVALNTGNLARVGLLMRQRCGDEQEVIYCADDDRRAA